MRYRDAGVDVARSEAIKQALGAAVRSTWTGAVRPLERGFAGLMDWPDSAGRALAAATMDGVGTKLHLALEAGRVGDAARDLVYHGANDLLVHGAQPLAMLDYIAQERLDPEVVLAVVEGLAAGCREVGAVLLGGETAEMPDTYRPRVVDVAGCMIGVVDRDQVLDGSACRPGDVLLGLASEGLHTNGYSLARRVLSGSGLGLTDPLPGGSGESVGEALLAPHRWYGRSLGPLLRGGGLRALAHVTGGGLAGNLERVLPPGLGAAVDPGSWSRPALFRWLIAAGDIPEPDARESFNLGVGMVAVCDAAAAESLRRRLEYSGERVHEIGRIVPGNREVVWTDSH